LVLTVTNRCCVWPREIVALESCTELVHKVAVGVAVGRTVLVAVVRTVLVAAGRGVIVAVGLGVLVTVGLGVLVAVGLGVLVGVGVLVGSVADCT
jgi:hypothetical protein